MADEGRPSETVEFGGAARPTRRIATYALVGLVGAGLGLHAVTHHKPAVARVGRSDSVPDHHQVSPGPRPVAVAVAEPSAAIISAFAQHLPGSIVVSERTTRRMATGETSVRRRVITAVTGNVKVKVTIARAGATARHQVVHHGYVFTFRFEGYYPPTGAQLHALADDPRLVSVQS